MMASALGAAELGGDMSRRRFLAGSGVLFGALLLGPNGLPRPGALARLSRAGLPRLSVGYVEGSAGLAADAARQLLTNAGTRVVPGASLRTTARGVTAVRIRIGSVTPGVGAAMAAQVDALLAPPAAGDDQPLPFYAWTRTSGGVSGSSEFTAPVAPEPTLGFAMRHGGKESVAVFTGGRDRGLPKLHLGLYLLAFGTDAWDSPRLLDGEGDPAWSRLGSLAMSVHR